MNAAETHSMVRALKVRMIAAVTFLDLLDADIVFSFLLLVKILFYKFCFNLDA